MSKVVQGFYTLNSLRAVTSRGLTSGFYSLGLTFGVHGFTTRGLAPNFPTSSCSFIFFSVQHTVVLNPRVFASKRLTSRDLKLKLKLKFMYSHII